MIAKIGRNAKGADETQNKPKNDAPFLTKPTIVTVRKTAIAKTAVTAKCDVVVNDIGNKPKKFAVTMNMNSVMM